MQIFRLSAVFIAMILSMDAILARADNDTPSQAAARAALEQQLNQMNGEESAGSTSSMTMTPPAVPATPPPAAAQQAPLTMPTPQFSTNVPVNAEIQSKLAPSGMSLTNQPPTAEMNTRTTLPAMTAPPSLINTNETEQYPVNPPMAPLPPPQAETTPPAALPGQTHPVPAPASGSGNEWPKTIPGNSGTQQLPPEVANGPGPSIQNETPSTNGAPSLESITAPPLPISQEQQAELQNLLSQYMANQITPEQYQDQRAKILGRP